MDVLLLPFFLLISIPGGAFIPAILLTLWVAKRWHGLGPVRRLISGGAAVLWLAYAPYETWMYFWMQSVVAPIRVDLLLIGPLLVVATPVAIVATLGGGRGVSQAVPRSET